MRKLLVLLVLAGIGVLIYSRLTPSAPVKAYRELATALAQGRLEDARELAGGEKLEAVLGSSRSSVTPRLMETFHRVSYEIESESRTGDQVEVRAVQSVYYDPPGVYSGFGAMGTQFRHVARLEKGDLGWRVVSLRSEEIQTVEIRPGKQPRKVP